MKVKETGFGKHPFFKEKHKHTTIYKYIINTILNMDSYTIEDPITIKLVMDALKKTDKKIIIEDDEIIEYFENNKEVDPQACFLDYIRSLKNDKIIVLSNTEIIEYFNTLDTPPEKYLLEHIKSPKNNIPIDEINAHYKEYERYTEDIDKIIDSLKTLNTKTKKNTKYFLWKYIKDKPTDFKCDICQLFVSKNYKGLSIHKRSCVPCKEKPEKGKYKKPNKLVQTIKESSNERFAGANSVGDDRIFRNGMEESDSDEEDIQGEEK